MTESRLAQLEASVDELSLTEQFWLMERLVQRIRDRSLRIPGVSDDEFDRMSRDPAIQRESKEIETEFALADADGLDDHS
jgi:hypothetical protein